MRRPVRLLRRTGRFRMQNDVRRNTGTRHPAISCVVAYFEGGKPGSEQTFLHQPPRPDLQSGDASGVVRHAAAWRRARTNAKRPAAVVERGDGKASDP